MEREREIGEGKTLEERMVQKFPNLRKNMNKHIQEPQPPPRRMKSRRPTSRNIIPKLSKFKDKKRILKRELTTYKELPIRLAADFSLETIEYRDHADDSLLKPKEKISVNQEFCM